MNLNTNDSEDLLNRNLSGQQDIDWQKLGVVIKHGLPWIALILMACIFTSYLIIRYTKPLYESYSEIKLGREDQSNILKLPEFDNSSSYALLSSEMELITSRLFFNKIIESVRLNPQYFTYGKILDDEKYGVLPFKVDYQFKNLSLYNKNIDITIIDNTKFLIAYTLGQIEVEKEYSFGQRIENKDFIISVHLSPSWNASMGNKHYFVVKSHDMLIRYLEDNLSVEPVNIEANIFRVSFKDYNLTKAHNLISAIDTLYYKYSLDEKNIANKNKINYLATQLKETEEKLDEYEKYFEDVTISNKTVGLAEDIKRTVNLINGIDSQKVHLEKRLLDLSNLAIHIRKGQIVTITTINNKFPSHIILLINELNLLINEREKLGLSYRENTYTYKSRQKEIDLLKADLLAQIDDSRTNISENISLLRGQKLHLNRLLNQLPSKNTEYNKIKRFYTQSEQMYLYLMQSKNEFEIAIAGSTTKIKILSPATMPNTPIKPNKAVIYAIAGAVFFFLLFVFVLISYLAHNKINKASEVERNTTATMLGSVPKYKSLEKYAKIIVGDHPKSALSESMRSIRTNMEFMLPDIKTKVYSFTSTVGSEGKTFISSNLGALLAMAGKRVIVLDLDLRRPKVHEAFNHKPNDSGMSTLLIKKHNIKKCIVNSDIENLDYIAAGPVPPNPSELLLRKSFDEILNQLKEIYDIIILDTPPIGIVTDGLLAMQKADLPIYVLRADYSKLSFIGNINRLLATGRYPNLSVILNSVTTTRSGNGYSYGDVYTKSPYYQE